MDPGKPGPLANPMERCRSDPEIVRGSGQVGRLERRRRYHQFGPWYGPDHAIRQAGGESRIGLDQMQPSRMT